MQSDATTTTSTTLINGVPHHIGHQGFLEQTNPEPFVYSADYKAAQQTTPQMAWLRIGVIEAAIGAAFNGVSNVLELGPGTGEMLRALTSAYGTGPDGLVVGYDVGEPYAPVADRLIGKRAAQATKWGLLVACDVLEHMKSPDELWDYDFSMAYLSWPEPPNGFCEKPPETTNWRHFKPNEHVRYIEFESFKRWVNDHCYACVYSGFPEDAIRVPQYHGHPNIRTAVIMRLS